MLTQEDPRYPSLLRQIPQPPTTLYVSGDPAVLSRPAVAVVGTRRPTLWGLKVAAYLARFFVTEGVVVVSGLAYGIDTAVHQAVIDAGGITIAVLGTALNDIYPRTNQGLAAHIVETGGALVSELPPTQHGSKESFVLRDRIQTGLSLATIPVQTTVDGGTLRHTVRFARGQNRLIGVPAPLKTEYWMQQYQGILVLQSMATMAPDILPFSPRSIANSSFFAQLRALCNTNT